MKSYYYCIFHANSSGKWSNFWYLIVGAFISGSATFGTQWWLFEKQSQLEGKKAIVSQYSQIKENIREGHLNLVNTAYNLSTEIILHTENGLQDEFTKKYYKFILCCETLQLFVRGYAKGMKEVSAKSVANDIKALLLTDVATEIKLRISLNKLLSQLSSEIERSFNDADESILKQINPK